MADQMITKLTTAEPAWATATPASTVRTGDSPPSRPVASASVTASAASAPTNAATGSAAVRPSTSTADRPHRRPGGDPEQVGVGERVAGEGLHDGADHRQARPDGGRGDHPRGPALPDDRVLDRA